MTLKMEQYNELRKIIYKMKFNFLKLILLAQKYAIKKNPNHKQKLAFYKSFKFQTNIKINIIYSKLTFLNQKLIKDA
jgi:TRAP-type mannitol/chloroaromatic compound transport system permease small subunit